MQECVRWLGSPHRMQYIWSMCCPPRYNLQSNNQTSVYAWWHAENGPLTEYSTYQPHGSHVLQSYLVTSMATPLLKSGCGHSGYNQTWLSGIFLASISHLGYLCSDTPWPDASWRRPWVSAGGRRGTGQAWEPSPLHEVWCSTAGPPGRSSCLWRAHTHAGLEGDELADSYTTQVLDNSGDN